MIKAKGIASLLGLTRLNIGGCVPLGLAAQVLASAAPSLCSLALYIWIAQENASGQLAAAVGSLRQLTALECWSHAVLPLLPAGGQLRELHVHCACCDLRPGELAKLGSLGGLRSLVFWGAPFDEGDKAVQLRVGSASSRVGYVVRV